MLIQRQGCGKATQAQRAAAGPLIGAQKRLVAALANDQKDCFARGGVLKAGPPHHKKNNGRLKSMDLITNINKVKAGTQGRQAGGGRRDIKAIA